MFNEDITVICACPFCHKEYDVIVPFDGYLNWKAGELLQVALPKLVPAIRESLLTGMCQSCQDNFYNDDDEEDEDDDDYYKDDGSDWPF